MSWSYSGNPSTSALDEVRFLIGDTDPSRKMLQDEEILYNLGVSGCTGERPPAGSNFLAAAFCANVLSSMASRSVDKSVGDLSISHGQQVKNFMDLSNALMRRATLAGVPVYAGGIYKADKEANYNDPTITKAAIKIDGMNHASTGNDVSGLGSINDSTEGP